MPVVAETWDGYLNDTNGSHVTPQTAIRALDAARSGPLAEGSVGGGTGMNCYGFKGGTGTASRQVCIGSRGGAGPGGRPPGTPRYTVGVLMQANFGRRSELVIAGRRIGEEFRDDNPLENSDWSAPPGSGSCIVIVATDAPLLPGQCKALARRVPLGLARTGTSGSHFSGDLFLAFSTANVGMLDSAIDARGAGDRLPSIEFIGSGQIRPAVRGGGAKRRGGRAQRARGRPYHVRPGPPPQSGIPGRTTPLAARRLGRTGSQASRCLGAGQEGIPVSWRSVASSRLTQRSSSALVSHEVISE